MINSQPPAISLEDALAAHELCEHIAEQLILNEMENLNVSGSVLQPDTTQKLSGKIKKLREKSTKAPFAVHFCYE